VPEILLPASAAHVCCRDSTSEFQSTIIPHYSSQQDPTPSLGSSDTVANQGYGSSCCYTKQ